VLIEGGSVAPAVSGPALTVYLDLRDTTVRLALSFAVEEAGWRRTRTPMAGAVHVADRVRERPDAAPLDVLVIHPSPAASRRALDAFARGAVRSVLVAGEPRSLPWVLHLGRCGLAVVPVAVVEAAHAFPALAPRLERTLELLLRGCTNRAIATTLHQSEATAKRDVAELLRIFDAPNRMTLAATAIRLGVHPDGRL
jgi:DNA-binding NarL/FixJ family response regulator